MFETPDLDLILKEYNRTKKSFEEDVTILKAWLNTQPHFPEIMDDKRLKNFLLLNKCSVEKTKGKIDNYYTMPSLIPELFLDLDCDKIKQMNNIAYWVMLPKLTKDLCRVYMIKMRNPDLINDLQPIPHFAKAVQILEMRLKEDIFFKDIIVMDMDGLNWAYLLKVSPSVLTKILKIYENIYSNRLKAAYIINSLPSVYKILTLLKTVIKPKLFDRIHICEGIEILHEVFQKQIIPRDYGGDEISMEELHILQEKNLNKYKTRFEEIKQMSVNESLRPEPLKNDELLGFYGSFKTLTLD